MQTLKTNIRQISYYLLEPTWQIRSYLLEPIRQITPSFVAPVSICIYLFVSCITRSKTESNHILQKSIDVLKLKVIYHLIYHCKTYQIKGSDLCYMILYTVFITIEDISITKAAKETKSIKTSQTMRVQINVK